MFISNAYAQAAGAGAGAENGLMSFLPLVLMFVVLYFVMIRPQMKRQKEQRAMIDALKKNDEVVTVGGVIGRVTAVSESYVTLEIADKVEVKVQKNAVSVVLPTGTIKSA
ncbi:preprotein translocase subunit YajC [Undibacterium squillarum]|uniref:Sec translocon accessory complex subunit YajC n=1 Tax=Undibacterium squillarum TaxID=1131567 RepID=A0ABQ2XZK8_9BURK|nr:preprotein translocase subunit YajC [Undibacterium squillarum]GGX46328.1 preprotein translocase subunit YajC [Undibacterium squillarum]